MDLCENKNERRKKWKHWVREIYQRLEQLGAFATLVKELRTRDREY